MHTVIRTAREGGRQEARREEKRREVGRKWVGRYVDVGEAGKQGGSEERW